MVGRERASRGTTCGRLSRLCAALAHSQSRIIAYGSKEVPRSSSLPLRAGLNWYHQNPVEIRRARHSFLRSQKLLGRPRTEGGFEERAWLSILAIQIAAGGVTVATQDSGSFEFISLTIKPSRYTSIVCTFVGEVDNRTQGTWHDSLFLIEAKGSMPGQEFKAELLVAWLPFGEKKQVEGYCRINGQPVPTAALRTGLVYSHF